MTTKFVHLNLHSEYAISDSIVRVDKLIQACCEKNMPAVAITDQNNLFALVKFYKAALADGVKPIIGVDVWLENLKDAKNPFKLLLFAQNQIGYKNILKLVSRGFIKGQHLGVPIIKKEWVHEFAPGLIALSGGKDGDVGHAILAGSLGEAKYLLNDWQQIFGDRYYVEIQRTGRAREEEYLQEAVNLAHECSVPVVATNAVRFLVKEDFEAHEARVCINSGHILADPNRLRVYSEEQYLRTPLEMEEIFHDFPESLANSVEIAKRCNVELTLGKTFLPIFPVENGDTPEIFFASEARSGVDKRLQADFDEKDANFVQIRDNYFKRLEYEIGVINKMGFASYFLIVADFIRWAKQNGVPVGPGRGSGAGSLVAYALGITNLDPIKHGLLFERFLNPERVSLPDFDIDFCMDGRDRVIEYVVHRYGEDKVAQIITYGTMAARAVVRDVGRVLGHPYPYVDKIAKLIPFEIGISLKQALLEEELLQKRYNEEEDVKTLIDLAQKIEGITRNAGKHAGGVVIAPSALTDFMPLYAEEDGGGVVTQLDKDDVEAVGLVKFDFLGLRTLTIINWAVQSINALRARCGEPLLDIDNLPLDDAATYKLLQSCNTTAVFQLESRISRDVIKKFQPDCFTDIVALVAIIRPGVLQSGMMDEFMDRKHGRAPLAYLHPLLEPILRQTYGVAIYQEQVMQMAQSLAGYSLGAADLLRRAMGKKKPEEMALQRSIFIAGAEKNHIDKHLANTIFDVMEKFAGYGFNKSHSAAYALIAYQTAWLKTHYPAEFMAAVLSSDMDNTDKVVLFLNDCKNINLKVLPPHINSSNYNFTVTTNGEINYGLGAIKGVGQAAVEAILEARKLHGPFKSLFDLCARVDVHKVNKRVLEALICAGAFDEIGPGRASMIATVETALRTATQRVKRNATRQADLFEELMPEEDKVAFEYMVASEWGAEERLKNEKKVLGFYLNGHPIEQYTAELNEFISGTICELMPAANKTVLLAGFVKALKIVNTKSGNRLAIVTIEDLTGAIDVTLFAESFAAARECLVEDQLVIVEGEVGVDTFSDGFRVRATKAMNLDQARMVYVRSMILKVAASAMNKLYGILNEYRGKGGNCPVFIEYSNDEATARLALGDAWKVQPTGELLAKLKNELGPDGAKFMYTTPG